MSMLPRATKNFRPALYIDTKNQSKERLESNKSANLPKYKKFSSNHLSQHTYDRKRPSLLVANSTPFKRKGRFFTEESESKMHKK